MLKTLFKSIANHLSSNKTFAAINIGGLAIGIGCSLIIFIIIAFETSFDNYHKNYENIYRLIIEYKHQSEGINFQEGQVHPLGGALRNDFSEINAAMTFYAEEAQISIENKEGILENYQEKSGLVYAEAQIFEIFDFDFLAGNPENALKNKASVVISSSLAQKYFNVSVHEVSQALNQNIIIDNKGSLQITGVIADPPKNTDLPFTIIANYQDQTISNPYFRGGIDWQEGNSATNCYLLLPNNTSVTAFENKLISFYKKYNTNNNALDQRYVLQELSELHSGLCNNYNKRQVPDKYLWILGIIALFLILIASINFINLSVVQATKRFKEIGIKKIHGETKTQSILYFLLESVVITLIAALIGLLIAHTLMIYLEKTMGYTLETELLTNPLTLLYLCLFSIIIGLLSGLYPASIIAGMDTNVALKNSLTVKNSACPFSLRSILITIQFSISLILIIGTLVMSRQMSYFMNKELGFKKEAILLAPLPNSNKGKLKLLKEKLQNHPEIEMICYGTRSPLADWRVNTYINHPTLKKDETFANLKSADEYYIPLFELQMIAGRNFSQVKDNREVVINRKLAKVLGFNNPNEAIGEHFEFGSYQIDFNIVGVVEDFHAQSLQKSMENVIFSNLSFNINEMAIKINPNSLNLKTYQESMKNIQTEWDQVFPNNYLELQFFDEKIASLYQEEENTSYLIQLFAIIAILIASLGLYGLISYVISQKTKEISIRKVNGASVSEILMLLNKDFVLYFGIAFIIACPISYYIMDLWLENFAYKTVLSWWLFAIAGFATLIIALMTVSGQSFRAARKNPVKAFRYE